MSRATASPRRRQLLRAACATPLSLALGPVPAGAQGAASDMAKPANTASAATAASTAACDWRSVPFGGGGFVNGFVFHPRQAGLLYARTDIGGGYRFDPATRAWQPLLDHLGRADADLMGVLSLALDPTDPDRLYAACGLYTDTWARRAALLASTDRGASWTTHELGLHLAGNGPGRGSGERLQVDPTQPARLWLGTTRDGLWRSDDRGQRFSRLPFKPAHVSLVLLAPRAAGQPPLVWVGSHDQPGLYLSRDDGQHFEREPGTPDMAPQRAALGPDGTLYVSFAAGAPGEVCNPGYAQRGAVMRRSPDGRWHDITPVPTRGFGWSGLDVDARVPGRLVASTIERWRDGDDLFLSTDHGASWQALGARSHHVLGTTPWLQAYTRGEQRMGHWLSDVKLDPADGQRAVYGTGYGLWLTHNLGAAQQPGGTVAWDFAVTNLEETAALDVKSPSGGATLLAALGDVSGAAWDDIARPPAAGLFSPAAQTCRSVDFAWLNPAIVARTADQQAGGGHWSADGGASWQPFAATPVQWQQARARGAECGQIAVSARGGFFVWAPDRQPALCSRDHGRSWQLCEGWPADRSVALTPVADRHVEGVFYVHDRAAGTVLASTDGGQRFKPVVQGLPAVAGWQAAQLLAAPGAARDLWLALPDALLHLPGVDQPARTVKPVVEPWLIALGQGLPGAAYGHSLVVWGWVQVDGVTSEGLFRSDDGGARFLRLNTDRQRYGRLLALSADPLAHGVVYLATHGRGVMVGQPRAAT